MNQDRRHQNYGQQFGFDHYDLPPGRKNIAEKIFGENVASKIRSPFFAAAALLLTGAAFAGIIIASYPAEQSTGEIPTVKADTFAYKQAPAESGGMDIPNRDTTIFQTMAEGQSTESPPIENLLADEQPIDKLAAFQRQVEEIAAEEAAAAGSATAPSTVAALAPTAEPVAKPKAETSAPEKLVPEKPASDQTPAANTASAAMAAKKIVPSAEPAQDQLASTSSSGNAAALDIPDPVPPSAAMKAKPAIEHKAGENPETLEYVRSVLERRDGVPPAPAPAEQKTASAVAEQVSKVEPASGLSAKPGSYYIQLGSVTSESGASSEWGKFQKAYTSQLEGLSYRVQKADLDKGTFYRIQAGPISKESAKTLCDSIKAQKPGGCLVTQ
jgi:hypothetical protein